jgi:L-2-hydroxyglutarate oxidase LhgO
MERIDAAVIGAGVVGLAIARALARGGRSVIVLEREDRFGTATSSRNSEVIHAGLHYPHGSLKERLCIAGKALLYAFCASHHVAHRRCGKLTFAGSESERARLEAIAAHATAAGADDGLAWLERGEVAAIEPAVDCAAALLTPSSGIVDAHGYMLALLGEAEDHGAVLACHAPVERIEHLAGGWRLHVGETRLDAGLVVNAAGLGAQAVARATEGLDPAHVPPLHPVKGNYFTYSGKVPFTRLIYPLPARGGLGVHLTLDLAGQARFGPDVEPVATIDYAVDPARKDAFLASVRRFWPEVDPDKLAPGYSGIRPRLTAPGEPLADFAIHGAETHGLPGLVNLFGIESPGLTASLAIAEHVVDLAGRC